MTTLEPKTALTPLNRAATLLRALGVIELPAKPGSERPSGQKVVGEIMATGALAYGVQALRDARGDAPSLPQLRDFALNQTADTGALFQERLAAWYGLSATDTEHCSIRHDPNVLPGTWGTRALGDPGPQRERACATGILSSATQGACAICHLRVSDAQELLKLAAKDRGRRGDRPLPSPGAERRGADHGAAGHPGAAGRLHAAFWMS